MLLLSLLLSLGHAETCAVFDMTPGRDGASGRAPTVRTPPPSDQRPAARTESTAATDGAAPLVAQIVPNTTVELPAGWRLVGVLPIAPTTQTFTALTWYGVGCLTAP